MVQSASIQDRALLVSLHISQWSAVITDKKLTHEVETTHNVQRGMTKVRKQLTDDNRLKAIEKVASAARVEHKSRTLAWTDRGERILSSAGYFDYKIKMVEYESAFWAAFRAFEPCYSDIYERAKVQLNGAFNPRDYPPAHRIASRFAFRVGVDPVPRGSDLRGEDIRIDIGDDELALLRAQSDSRAEEAIQATLREVASRIETEVGHMRERLTAYTILDTPTVSTNGRAKNVAGGFHDTLVGNIRSLVALLPTLNLTGDATITAITRRLETDLCAYQPAQLRESARLREDTVAKADAILADMSALFA